ncbi:MAG: hypothetical protein RLZZ227_2122 [Pseudomonadota bacterium]
MLAVSVLALLGAIPRALLPFELPVEPELARSVLVLAVLLFPVVVEELPRPVVTSLELPLLVLELEFSRSVVVLLVFPFDVPVVELP